MTFRYGATRLGWSARAVIALGVLAVLLVAAVPAAFFVGLILMLLGHVVGGLALFGASILAAMAAIVAAALGGVGYVRKAIGQRSEQFMRLRRGQYYYD
jgi:hypothetical protein